MTQYASYAIPNGTKAEGVVGDLSNTTPEDGRLRSILALVHEVVPLDDVAYVADTERLGYIGLLSELEALIPFYERALAGEYGAVVGWRADIDIEEPDLWCPQFVEKEAPELNEPLNMAAQEYKRECGWDFTPGAGRWLCLVQPLDVTGSRHEDPYDGVICPYFRGLAFAVAVVYRESDLYSDGDEEKLCLGHIWTCRSQRRKGYAAALLREVIRRYEIEHVDGPLTDDGHAFVAAVAPGLLEAAKGAPAT